MPITIDGYNIRLENEFIYREIDISQGISTTAYRVRPNGKKRGDTWYPVFAFEPYVPFEAAVTVNGVSYEAGPFQTGEDWDREGSFTVLDTSISKSALGDILEVRCAGRDRAVNGIELVIHYELAEKLPLLIKYLTVKNVSENDVVIDNATPDILRFLDAKIGLTVFSDYYWDVKKYDPYYNWTRIEFPEDIGMKLCPNESFDSFKCFEAVGSTDKDEESIILHRIYKELAPWITETCVKQTFHGCETYEELISCVDESADNGVEELEFFVGQLFTNTGDYIPRPDLFRSGYDDMKKLVDYCHVKNIKVLPYCSPTIAWHESAVCTEHPEWQYLGQDGIRYNPAGLGNMCYQSPWGDYIREKLFYLIDEIGFDGLALDGPYHGLQCLETNHRHKTPESVKFMNWRWEKQFYGEVVKRGKFLSAPQEWNALLLGVKERPGGYREEDQQVMGGMPLVVMQRSCLYDTRYLDPSCATWSSCNIDKSHGHSIEADEENTATYEHAIASLFGYGQNGVLFGKRLFVGENTKKIYQKWIRFFKEYKETLKGEMVHIAKPTGYEPDAVMHVSLKAEIPALLVVFNSVDKAQGVVFELPLQFAGFEPETTAYIEGIGAAALDSRAHCTVLVNLAPAEIKVIPITKYEREV